VKRPRGLTAAALGCVAALLALLGYGVLGTAPGTSIDSALAEGRRPAAPVLELPRLGGSASRSLAEWDGEVVVLNFWASWCGPCREESPMLERWHRRLRDRGATVLGVNVEDVTSDARDFIRAYGLSYPMLRDRDGDSAKPFGVVGYPETLVIDRRGRVAAVLRGPIDEQFMQREVAPLLEERA
jgi:cytochrome c biogenesis protein CcmG, thiol:disulfide interchange protein DsbE